MNNLEIEKLEREFEKKLEGQNKPNKNDWIPYKQFIKQNKNNVKSSSKLDDTTKQLYKDLEKQQKKDQKQLLKDIKKLSKELKMDSYKAIKKANDEVKHTEKHFKNFKKEKSIDAFYDKKYSLEFREKSSFMMKKFEGELFNFVPSVDINVNHETLHIITSKIYLLYTNIFSKFKRIYSQGFETVVKITFLNSLDDKNGIISLTLRKNPTLEDIKSLFVEKIINRFIGGDSDFSAILNDVTIYVFPLSKKGGCATCRKNVDKLIYRDRTVKLVSPKSTNDNCLFMCFADILDIKGNTLNFKEIRKELGIKEGMIEYTEVRKVADYFKCGYILLNQEQKIISHKDLKNKPNVHIMLMKDHYYIVEYIDYFHCELCGKKLLKSNETHVCNNKSLTFYRSQKLKKHDFVDMIDCTDKKGKIAEDTMIFFDLETFQETVYHVPYACGFSYGDHKNVDISYGKDCMKRFIEYIVKQQNKVICAYNGSGFDFYILINYLKDLNIPISNLILSNGRVLSFKFGKDGEENKVFDLYLFITASLDKACKGYNIKNHKMKFDVLKVQSWKLAEQYRHEVEPYLKYDVLSLSELFFCFNDSIYEQDQVNITKYVTLSNMAYSLWQSSLTDLIEILDIEKYNFSKRSTYGARCYPNQKEFKSKHYDDVINGSMKYDDLIKTNDYIYNGDATSLYPASMAGFELLDAQYPTGKSRWSDKPETEFKNNKYGFYEINFVCPKDIVIPILPRKTNTGGLEWSLYDGYSGVYTNVEIKNALSVGYKIEFINRCLVWDKTSDNVFKPYVTKYYKMKEDAEKEKNPVKRSIAKLLLNAMYGKTLQRAIYENTAIINDYNQLLDFFKDYEITDINMLSDSKLLLTGTALNKQEKITKPSQLGAFVLSYSRQIMMNYFKAIDPTLKTHIFSYTDTDSAHILGHHAKLLAEKGMIKPKNEASLGYLCSDIDDEGIIIYENNLAPKTYFYEYIDNKNGIHDKNNGTMKAKGIPKRCLDYKIYDDYKTTEPVKFSGLRKKHLNLTKADIKNGVGLFSIVNNTQQRTFNKTNWGGMVLKDNKFYPKGFEFK